MKRNTLRLLRLSSKAWNQYQALRATYGATDARTVLAFQNFKTFRSMLEAR